MTNNFLSRKILKRLAAFVVSGLLMVAIVGCTNKEIPSEAMASSMTVGDVSIKIEVGQPAPDFTSIDAQGNTVSLSGFQPDQPVLLVF
ncbi:MAG: hypothetical protein ACPH15_05640, partial [Pseudomonadales bacterium]